MEDGAWLGDCPGVDIVVAFEKESDWTGNRRKKLFSQIRKFK